MKNIFKPSSLFCSFAYLLLKWLKLLEIWLLGKGVAIGGKWKIKYISISSFQVFIIKLDSQKSNKNNIDAFNYYSYCL